MSGLNLVPNPTILTIQLGIFLSAFLIIKKMILKPYLLLREKRLAATEGNKDLAEKLNKESDGIGEKVKDGLVAAGNEIRQASSDIRDRAVKERQNIVSAAEKQAKQEIEIARKQIMADVDLEKKKLADVVKSLSDQIFASITR